MNDQPTDEPIRISRQEALSRRVDDLLQRQRNMRGQASLAGKRTPWYLRNWLVLSLAGALGAFVAWAAIEPSFDDEIYVQGTIQEVKLGDELAPFRARRGGQATIVAQLKVNDTLFWVPVGARELHAGEGRRLDPEQLRVGQEVGLYSKYIDVEQAQGGVVGFVDLAPPAGQRTTQSLAARARRSQIAGFFLFAIVAGFVGLAIGGADGIVCRLPRRAVLCGLVGLIVGLVGGFFSSIIANVVYSPLTDLAQRHSEAGGGLTAFGFLLQMVGRAIAWSLAGLAMGLGQGVALRSPRLLLFGLVGGVLGGLAGGLLFDPIDLIVLGVDKPSAHWSRMVGFTVIGAAVGAMIGVVELLARDAWLRMTEGSLAGKEFLLFKDVLRIGSSPQSDIYLFGDATVEPHHATLRSVGDSCELENHSARQPVLVNGRSSTRTRLNHGDQITIGRTSFLFQRRQAA